MARNILVVVIAILLVVAGVGLIFAPMLAGPRPDNTWKSVYYGDVDELGATWISNKWSCQLTVYSTGAEDSGNVIFVGNGHTDNGKGIIQIANPQLARFTIIRPGAYMEQNADGKLQIVTPQHIYVCDDVHDYCLITAEYNILGRCFRVWVLGYSGFASQAGAIYVINCLGSKLRQGGYAVIKYTGVIQAGLSTEDWMNLKQSDFTYTVVEVLL